MSNIGSISNSGNKFNVVASTLSTEQLEGFGKSGNLMPNAIIVSTSYINSYDNSLDLVISDKDGYGQSIMKDYKNAIETVSQHIYFTSNTTKPKYKTRHVQKGENGKGPETISLNKAIYTFAKDYSYIGSRFLTYDGKYSLNHYFSYLFSIIKHEKILITVTDLVLNSISSTPGYVTFKVSPNYNKDYITVGFKNGKNEPNIRFYNSFEGKLKESNKNITDDVKAEFNTNDLLESKCYIRDRDVSTSYISINSPNYGGEDFSEEGRKITCYVPSDITTQNYKTYGIYYKDVLVGIEGHNSNITVLYDNDISPLSPGAILDKFPVENESYRNLEVKFDNGLQLYYNGNSDSKSAKAYFNIDGGKLKSSDDGFTYSYKSVIYPAYNDQKQIIVNHKWINTEGRKNTNIYIKPNPSIFLVNKNDNDHRYYLTYNTGNYIPTGKNRFLPISNESHVSCKNYSKENGWSELSSNFITYDINTYSTALEIKDTAYEITDDIHYHGVYKVNVECTNTYLNNTYINNDEYYIVCSTVLSMDDTDSQRRTLSIDSQYITEDFPKLKDLPDLKDLYVNNACSYLADTSKILYIGVNYKIDGSEWVKDPNNIYYYKITSVEESNDTYASKLYKYKIDKNETSDSLYIIFGLREYKDDNFTTPDVPESSNMQNYYIKFNIYFCSNRNRINISENCKIKYWYINNGTRYEYTENIESTKKNHFSIPKNIAVQNKLLKYQIIKNNNVDLQYDDILFDDASGKVRESNINSSEINITLPSSKINENTIQFNINKISMPFLKLDYEDYNRRGYKYVVLNILNNEFILCTLEPYETEISDINVTIEDKENSLYNKECVFTVYYHSKSGKITNISDLSTISTDIVCKTDPNPIIADSKIIYINELNFILEN